MDPLAAHSILVWLIVGLLVTVVVGPAEFYGLTHPDRQFTLSRTIRYLGNRWPITIWIVGALFGILFVHFFFT